MDAICRICLFSTSEFGNNDLISPCDCSGSMRYVHLECILRWQQYAENDENLVYCELCTIEYNLPTKWPLENKPIQSKNGSWFLLQRSYVWMIISYYLYFMILTLYNKFYTHQTIEYNSDINTIIKTEQEFILDKYNLAYMAICGFLTCLYACEYYYHISIIQNKRIYLYYWYTYIPNIERVWQPRSLLFLSILSFSCIPLNIIYGIPYLYSLTCYFDTHCAIVNQMNKDAQFIL